MQGKGLIKENFWDNIEKRYPVAFKNFSEWIDKYKQEVKWDQLFGNGRLMPIFDEIGNKIGGKTKDTKFHDLPYDMQTGIILRYMMETTSLSKNFPLTMQMRISSIDLFKLDVAAFFAIENNQDNE